VRRDNDAYFTTPELAQALVDTLDILPGDEVLEPHAGGGAFVEACGARRRWSLLTSLPSPRWGGTSRTS
jgi:hypothetical protein